MGDLTKYAKEQARKKLSEKYGWSCYYCGMSLVPDDKREDESFVTFIMGGVTPKEGYDFPELDHLTPRILEGSNDISNLVLSCGTCNHTKNRKTETEFIEWRSR